MSTNPNVNGFEYSFASIELRVRGKRYYGATSISTADSLEPGYSEGTQTTPTGWTAGKWTPGSNSIEFGLHDGQQLLDDLGDGYGRISFQVLVQYAEEGMPVVTVELPVCRIKSVDNGATAGGDPTKIKFDLALLKPIKRNGKAIERSAAA